MKIVFLIFVLTFTLITTQDYDDSSLNFVDGSDEDLFDIRGGHSLRELSLLQTNGRKRYIANKDKNKKEKKNIETKDKETDSLRNDQEANKSEEANLKRFNKVLRTRMEQGDDKTDEDAVEGTNGEINKLDEKATKKDHSKEIDESNDDGRADHGESADDEEHAFINQSSNDRKEKKHDLSDTNMDVILGNKRKVNSSIPKIKSDCCNAQIINVFHYLDLESRHMCFKKLEVQNMTVEKQVEHRACVAECIARHKRYLTSRGKLFITEFTNNIKVAFRDLRWVVKILDEVVNTCVEKYELYSDSEAGCSTKILNIGQCVGRKLQYECYENYLPNEDKCLQDFFDVKYYKCIAPSPGFGCHTIR